jgi:hypothetical protein
MSDHDIASKASALRVRLRRRDRRTLHTSSNDCVQDGYGGISQVFPNGTREWNVFLCGIVFNIGSSAAR